MVHFVSKLYKTLTWNDTNLTQKCDEHGARSEPSRPLLPLKTSDFTLYGNWMVMACQTFGGSALRRWEGAQWHHFRKKQKLTTTDARGLRAILCSDFPETFAIRFSGKQGLLIWNPKPKGNGGSLNNRAQNSEGRSGCRRKFGRDYLAIHRSILL